MRSLKFRFYDSLNGVYLGKNSPEFRKSSSFDECKDILLLRMRNNEFITEQYIGLKDKNGKEIYEGDIVKMPDWQASPRTEIVKYHKAGFDPFQEGCLECWAADGEEVEVIGNIHENPELLGGEK